MTLQIDFLPFGGDPASDAMSQAAYAANSATTLGVSTGTADPTHATKAWRQSSLMVAALAQAIGQTLNQNVIDGGTAGVPALTSQIEALITALATAVGPKPGILYAFAGTTVPTGYILCFGQALSRTTFAALFNAIGTTWGAGDGSTTFNLPDLRGRSLSGMDNMGGTAASRLTAANGLDGTILGQAGGEQVHVLTVPETPAHTHTFGYGGAGFTNGGNAGVNSTQFNGLNTGSTGGGGAHNNMQPTAVVNYIIKT